jgi:hypothetical protein
MKTSSCLGVQIRAILEVILAIRAVFGHFFEWGESGRFTGVSGGGIRETGADSGLDWGGGRGEGEVNVEGGGR